MMNIRITRRKEDGEDDGNEEGWGSQRYGQMTI